MTTSRLLRPRPILALSVAALGCSSSGVAPQSVTSVPRSQDRAGSAHVAVLSVAPWQEYVNALQPSFPMDEQRALAEAIPNTLDIERRLMDVFALNARVALPTTVTRSVSRSSTTVTGTSGSAADGSTSQDGSRSEAAADSASRETNSGRLADVTTRALPSAGAAPRPSTSPLDGTAAIDPFVRYTAATSLLQEVRLLQRYVRDVVIGPEREAYVMRIQVTLMPSRRDLPVDAYSTLSFFATRVPSEAEQQGAYGVRPFGERGGQLETTNLLGNVRVVPIMVSDNVEGAAEAASSAIRREVALGLVASIAGAGLGAEGGRAIERLEGIFGRQLNSLLTVGQVSTNTLRVRFGAMNQPRGGLGLVPRNQMVTVLVIVPKQNSDTSSPRAVRVIARTDFVDGRNGDPLAQQTRQRLHQRVDDALKQYDVQVSDADPAVFRMLAAVQDGNVRLFTRALGELQVKCSARSRLCPSAAEQRANAARYSQEIWMDLGSILATHPYAVTLAPLPPTPDFHIEAQQRPLAVDDGKRISVTVEGSPGLRAGEFWASMPITAAGATMSATSVSIDQFDRLNVVLPSPAGLGYCSTDPKAAAERCKIESLRICRVMRRWEADDGSHCAIVPVALVSQRVPPPATVGFRLAAGARVIGAAPDRTGAVRVVVMRDEKAPDGARIGIRVDGAEVASMTATPPGGAAQTLGVTNGTYELSSSAVLTIRLENLDESEPVLITATGGAQPDRLQFRVVSKKDK